MTLYEVCSQVVNSGQFVMIRPNDGVDSYTIKTSGSKKGWTVIDSWSASCYVTVYEAISADNRAKLIELPIMRQFDIAFKSLIKP